MCGICGSFSEDGAPIDGGAVRSMLDALVHRGPDAGGLFEEPGIAAGIRRLAVIDIDGGDQPIANEDGSVQVVFNGEIYNHRELRESLEQQGHRFRSRSDTEVLVHLWEEHGPELLSRLNGMFAFCIHDRRRREVFVARDRIGIKPLFYSMDGPRVHFASELRALLTHPRVDADLDLDALTELTALQYVPGDRTIYSGIRKLLPGHALHLKQGALRRYRYYRIPDVDPSVPGSPEASIDALLELLESSIAMRCVADVPVGLFLSGGLDSSGLLALLRGITDQPLETFSVGFDEQPAHDERAWARQVADRFDARHHELVVSAMQIAENLPRVTRHLAEPVMDPAILPTWLLSEYARRRVTVVLSGEGADELFAGYRRYRHQHRFGWAARLGGLGRLGERAVGDRLPGRSAQALDALLEPDPARNHLRWASTLGWSRLAQLFDQDRMQVFCERMAETFDGYFTGPGSRLDHQLRADQQEWLPHNLLAKVDRASMAHSLEARVPFLDHRIVAWAAALDDGQRLRDGVGKWVLRQALARRLPRDVLDRPKQGFDLPLADWMRGPLRALGDSVLAAPIGTWDGFNHEAASTMWHSHKSGERDFGLPLFNLVSVLSFLDLDRRASTT